MVKKTGWRLEVEDDGDQGGGERREWEEVGRLARGQSRFCFLIARASLRAGSTNREKNGERDGEREGKKKITFVKI